METNILSIYMQQKDGIINRIIELLDKIKPDRIIELGTGHGGLTIFYGLYTYLNHKEMYSYDNNPALLPSNIRHLLAFLNVNLANCNIFTEYHDIGSLIEKPGKVLLVCDDGDKVIEYLTFAPYLKTGDIAMLHDYYADEKGYARMTKGIRESWEIRDSDMLVCDKLYKMMPVNLGMWEYGWGFREKI